MNRCIFLVVVLLFANAVSAQSDFKEGYVILNSLDTLHGFINNNSYYKNSQYCEFKTSGADQILKYHPKDIFGYRFRNGKYYVSMEIDEKPIFLEYLINGELDIYFYQDFNSRNHYFASKNSIKLAELEYDAGIKSVEGVDYYYENKDYVGPLNFLTSDFPGLQTSILNMGEPDHRKLIRISRKYHQKVCDTVACEVYEKKVPLTFMLNVTSTVNVLLPFDEDRVIFYTPGFNVLMQQPTVSERLFVGLGIKYVPAYEWVSNYIIPLSFHYIHSEEGFSPYFAYDCDLYPMLLSSYNIGVNYRFKKIMVSFVGRTVNALFVLPRGVSAQLGVTCAL